MCPDVVETKLLSQRQREWQPDPQVINKWTVLYNLQKDYMDRVKPKIEGMKTYDQVLGTKLVQEKVERENLSNLIQFQNKVNNDLKKKSEDVKFNKDEDCDDDDQSYSHNKIAAANKNINHLSDFNKLLVKNLDKENQMKKPLTPFHKNKLEETMKNFFNKQNGIGIENSRTSPNTSFNPVISVPSPSILPTPLDNPISIPGNLLDMDLVKPMPTIYTQFPVDPLKSFTDYGKSILENDEDENKTKNEEKLKNNEKKKNDKKKKRDEEQTKQDEKKKRDEEQTKQDGKKKRDEEQQTKQDGKKKRDEEQIKQDGKKKRDEEQTKQDGKKKRDQEQTKQDGKEINIDINKIPSENDTFEEIKSRNITISISKTKKNKKNDLKNSTGIKHLKTNVKNKEQEAKPETESRKSDDKNKSNFSKLIKSESSKKEINIPIDGNKNKSTISRNSENNPIKISANDPKKQQDIEIQSFLQKSESKIPSNDEIFKLSSKLNNNTSSIFDEVDNSEEIIDPEEDPFEKLNEKILNPPQMSSFLQTSEFINFNKNLFEYLISKSSNFNLETQRRGRRRSRFPDPQWDCAESQISKLVIYLCEEEVSVSYKKYCKPIFEQINTMVESFLYHDNNLEICQNLHMCPVTMDIR